MVIAWVEWSKAHTFWKVGSVLQSSEDNDLIPFSSGTLNICLQSLEETASCHHLMCSKKCFSEHLAKRRFTPMAG